MYWALFLKMFLPFAGIQIVIFVILVCRYYRWPRWFFRIYTIPNIDLNVIANATSTNINAGAPDYKPKPKTSPPLIIPAKRTAIALKIREFIVRRIVSRNHPNF